MDAFENCGFLNPDQSAVINAKYCIWTSFCRRNYPETVLLIAENGVLLKRLVCTWS